MQIPKENYELRPTTHIGAYISTELFETLKHNYVTAFPEMPDAVTIPKALIEQVLALSPQVAGIRFMYGLTDIQNPQSLKVFLIPCTAQHEYDQATQPLIHQGGYYDQNGSVYPLLEVVAAIGNFVTHMAAKDLDWVHKTVTRGNFYGKHSLQGLMKDEQCAYILFYFGLEENIIKPISKALNADFQAFDEDQLDYTSPCPPVCFNTDTICFTESAVGAFSKEAELELHRHFRDTILLEMEEGATYYELYYFISPLIMTIINEESHREVILKEIYETKILPFKELLSAERYEEATTFLKVALQELAGEYSVVF